MDYEYAHQQLLESEKDVLMIKILAAFVYVVFVAGALLFIQSYIFGFMDKVQPIEAFMDTQESVMEELYGSPTDYADSKALHDKIKFIDQTKTAVEGSMQYDEDAYQAYYDSFIQEYYSQVDYEQINKILEEREKAFQKNAKRSAGSSVTLVMTWMFVLPISLVNAAYVLLYYQRYSAIAKEEYTLWEGTIVSKGENRNHISVVKTSAVVDCGDENLRVTLTFLQAMKMQEGDEVYVAEVNKNLLLKSAKCAICKR